MSRINGLIIPRSYNDYYNKSQPQDIINTLKTSGLIPAQASTQNQLADKAFVNSTVGTNTAIFRGTFNSVAELEAYAGEKTNNDYAFVIDTDSAGNTLYKRYKYNGTAWVYEYPLNNSSFTAAQWAAIQSGITAEKVALIPTGAVAEIDDTTTENNKAWSSNKINSENNKFALKSELKFIRNKLYVDNDTFDIDVSALNLSEFDTIEVTLCGHYGGGGYRKTLATLQNGAFFASSDIIQTSNLAFGITTDYRTITVFNAQGDIHTISYKIEVV